MKIDFLISSLSGGGAENVLVTIANELFSKGNAVSIVSLEKRPQFYSVESGIWVEKIDNTRFNRFKESWRDFWQLRRFIKESQAEYIVSFLSRCNLLALIANIGIGKPVTVCDRNNPLKEHSKFIFIFSCILYSLAKRIVVQTNQIKEMYPWYLQKKIIVIENPLNFDKLMGQLEDSEPKRENIVVSIGRLEEQKDFDTLIDAFHNVKHELKEDWVLKIYGIGKDREHLENKIANINASNYIQLCGSTKTPFKELKSSKIFVLSSFYEGFPNVLCEAMLAGNICISSDCVSGPRELIKNGVNGFLFPVQDVNRLEILLKECCIQADELIHTQGMEACKSVQRLNLPLIVDKWERLLLDINEES